MTTPIAHRTLQSPASSAETAPLQVSNAPPEPRPANRHHATSGSYAPWARPLCAGPAPTAYNYACALQRRAARESGTSFRIQINTGSGAARVARGNRGRKCGPGENNADDSALRKAWLLFEEEVGKRHPETLVLSADGARTLLCTH